MRMFMVETFSEDEDGCCFEEADERMFDDEAAARGFFEGIDLGFIWETEYRTSGFANRRTRVARVQPVEVDEDGEIEAYGEIIDEKSYGMGDHERRSRGSED